MNKKNVTSKKRYKFLFALPFLYVLLALGFILYKNGIFEVILSPNIYLEANNIEGIFDDILPLFPIGIILSILPLIIYVVKESTALVKIEKPNFNNSTIKSGIILSINLTGERLNRVPFYNIEVGILDSISNTVVKTLEKRVRIPAHEIHYLKINSVYNILENPNDEKDFFINFDLSQGWI